MSRFAVSFLLLAFLTCKSLCGQEGNEDFQKTISIRTNPLSILELDGGIMLGVNYQWSERFSVTADPMFIFTSLYRTSSGNSKLHPTGIKLRLDARYHFKHFLFNLSEVFIAPEFHYKHVNTKKWDNFGINCIGLQCNYYQYARYNEIKDEMGGSLKMGFLVPLGKDNWHWGMEFYAGLGVKVSKFKDTDLPVGGSFLNPPIHEELFGFRDDQIVSPLFPASVKIIYRLK